MTGCAPLDADLLRSMPLPVPTEGSKEERGRVTIIGGSRDVPGAVLLAGMGALRAGAGKLQIATVESRAAALALAMPEALVMPLPETSTGGIHHRAASALVERIARTNAVLMGPGMVEDDDTHALVAQLIRFTEQPPAVAVIDAGALPRMRDHAELTQKRAGNTVLTPHAGEMANLLGITKDEVENDPLAAAQQVAKELNAVVTMKGAKSFVVSTEGAWCFSGGNVGLATSGSGDTLAGIITGLAARGASATQAAIWGVYLHGEAGTRLASSVGPIGYLARELPDQVPRIMADLTFIGEQSSS